MRLLKDVREALGSYHLRSGVYHYYRGEFPQAEEFLEKARRKAEDPEAEDELIGMFLARTLNAWGEAGVISDNTIMRYDDPVITNHPKTDCGLCPNIGLWEDLYPGIENRTALDNRAGVNHGRK